MRVAICEQGTFGGTCLNVGCIPTKMFVYAAEVAATVRDAAWFGVDAHVDGECGGRTSSRGCSGGSTRSPSAANVTDGPPDVTVFASHTRFGPT